MSRSETCYYSHPYLTSSGKIGYKFRPYPCPESKKWDVLGEALSINIPEIYNKVIDDESSSPELIKKATNLHNTWKNSFVPEEVPEQVPEQVPEPVTDTITVPNTHISQASIEKMDEHNSQLAEKVNEEGWEASINKAAKGMTYADFRSRYG